MTRGECLLESMAEDQLTFKEDEVIQILNKVYLNLRDGLFEKAIELLDEALKVDLEYPGIPATLKCASYWQERCGRLQSTTDEYEKGEYLIAQWKTFGAFARRIGDVPERCMQSTKQYVYSTALNSFQSLREASGSNDPELLLRIGRCYKVIGNYERAIEYIEIASRQDRENPEVLADLADCYSLVNEIRAAKAFFREAFFLDPQRVDLLMLESPMMQRLLEKLQAMNIGDAEIPEWVPVYGTIWGVFSVKRELRPLELGKLKQTIFSLERALESQQDKHMLIPRLINRYFWLIDHYVSTKEEQQKIEEVILKIRRLNPTIYREYTD